MLAYLAAISEPEFGKRFVRETQKEPKHVSIRDRAENERDERRDASGYADTVLQPRPWFSCSVSLAARPYARHYDDERINWPRVTIWRKPDAVLRNWYSASADFHLHIKIYVAFANFERPHDGFSRGTYY
ncbi:hypothetical protein [Rhizobium freirei]|uniref:hypothetical protein n=1 Tax=Rhizobium freirei TaxID=1353277 RepID=UPI001F0AFDAD|nr:hypothetical protein [Rhizobium freirei]